MRLVPASPLGVAEGWVSGLRAWLHEVVNCAEYGYSPVRQCEQCQPCECGCGEAAALAERCEQCPLYGASSPAPQERSWVMDPSLGDDEAPKDPGALQAHQPSYTEKDFEEYQE
ncbi:uncharacterized protein GBIM_02728 [Gryllus bimaculatus]|nr:uncharacterized protein GBIM_02728 [Gryllus bimaculatus]